MTKSHKSEYLFALGISFAIVIGLLAICYFLFDQAIGVSDNSLIRYALNEEYAALAADQRLLDKVKDNVSRGLAHQLIERRRETIRLLETLLKQV